VASADICPLKAILPSCLHIDGLLGPTLFSRIGTVVHKIFESATGRDFDYKTARVYVTKELTRLLSLNGIARNSPIGSLSETMRSVGFSPKRTHEFVSMLIRSVLSLQGARSETDASIYKDDSSSVRRNRGLRDGSEVKIIDEELDLVGRIDRLHFGGMNTCHIIDHKSFSLRGNTGIKLARIRAQQELYSLLVLRNTTTLNIVVHAVGIDGSLIEIDVTRSILNKRERWMRNLVAMFPRELSIDAARIAKSGAGCIDCDIRPRCTEYTRSAPSHWTGKNTEVNWPLDIWGVISDVGCERNGMREIYLKDASNRDCRIQGLPRDIITTVLSPGMEISFYNLRTFERSRVRASASYPQNFYVSSAQETQSQARDVSVFSGVPHEVGAGPP
jgi:hypothetical protein